MEELEGHLLYLRHAAGSKSDSVRPHLVVAADRVVRLHRPGGNPFAEEEFRPWQGRACRITGRWDEAAQVFLVAEVRPLNEASA